LNEPFPIFFAKASDLLGRYEKVDQNVQSLSKRYPPSQYPKVLDMCSGIGHYGNAFAKLGYQVTGIELSAELVEYAKEKSTSPNVEYLVGSMEDKVSSGPFSLLINTYSSFGYMGSVEKDLDVLRNWYGLISEGGSLVMELTDLERAKHAFNFPNDFQDRESNGVREKLSMDWGKQMLTVDFSHGSQKYRGRTRIYETEQLIGMLKFVGFSEVSISGDFEESPKTADSRLILECRK